MNKETLRMQMLAGIITESQYKMKRIIRMNDGVIMGEDKKSIVDILPQLETSFRQRKQYFEYYFDETKIEITLDQLDQLSNEFRIRIGGGGEITVEV